VLPAPIRTKNQFWVPKPALGEVVEFLRLLTSQGGLSAGNVSFVVLCPMRELAFWRQRRPWRASGKSSWALLPPLGFLAGVARLDNHASRRR